MHNHRQRKIVPASPAKPNSKDEVVWAKVLEDIIDYVDGSNLQISLLFTLLHSAAACFTRLLLCIRKRKTIFQLFWLGTGSPESVELNQLK